MVIFIYNQKSFVRRRLRRYRLRHEIHAIKTRPNNPLRFLQHKNSYPLLFGKRLNLCRSQNDVQNKKTFSQQTIPATIQSITPKKQNITNKHDKLSHQSIVKSITETTTTNNPHNLSIKNALKTNTTYDRIITPRFLNIKKSLADSLPKNTFLNPRLNIRL